MTNPPSQRRQATPAPTANLVPKEISPQAYSGHPSIEVERMRETRMVLIYEGNPDGFPHRTCGCAAGAAPLPVYRWDLIKEAEARRRLGGQRTKSRLGETQPPSHARDMRETRMALI